MDSPQGRQLLAFEANIYGYLILVNRGFALSIRLSSQDNRTVRKTLHRPENLALIELLRELRVAADLRQVELADRLGVNQNFVSNVEQGIRRLDLIELRDYAAALEVPFLELAATWSARITDATRPPRAKTGKRAT